ncbi:MAG: ABC transporter substrate-binding protein [Deltaproteobacteria bacterium]|nr:ABC transporter substrate-binding protein [Deltaproteobacteria bacterium]
MIARILAVALSILSHASLSAAAAVRIAYSSISAAMLPLFVAKDKRLFEKYGVDVEVTYIRGVAIEALIAGEVHFVRASPPAVVRSTLRGADLAVIANTINVPVFSLMTRADLRRPEDLKGKKIGVTNLGDSPDLVLSMILDKFGLQRGSDVTVLAIRGGMPDMILALSKGFVDGGMISAPSNLRGIKQGLRELIDSADLGVPYLNSPMSTRRGYIKSNRDIVLRVLRGYYQGVQETHNDRDGAMKILARYTRVDEPEILAESYRIYGQKFLQKSINVDLEGVRQLLKTLGKEAAGAASDIEQPPVERFDDLDD